MGGRRCELHGGDGGARIAMVRDHTLYYEEEKPARLAIPIRREMAAPGAGSSRFPTANAIRWRRGPFENGLHLAKLR